MLRLRMADGETLQRPTVEQAARLVAANPAQKVGVYRNIVAAQPWFPSVAAKLRDPRYSSWFLPFKDDHSPTGKETPFLRRFFKM